MKCGMSFRIATHHISRTIPSHMLSSFVYELYFEILGQKPKPEQRVSVHYTGKRGWDSIIMISFFGIEALTNGKKFDSSMAHNKTFQFALDRR